MFLRGRGLTSSDGLTWISNRLVSVDPQTNVMWAAMTGAEQVSDEM